MSCHPTNRLLHHALLCWLSTSYRLGNIAGGSAAGESTSYDAPDARSTDRFSAARGDAGNRLVSCLREQATDSDHYRHPTADGYGAFSNPYAHFRFHLYTYSRSHDYGYPDARAANTHTETDSNTHAYRYRSCCAGGAVSRHGWLELGQQQQLAKR